jgi:integrase
MFKLKWSDIDLENGLINIQAFNPRRMRQRQVAITSRLAQELQALWGCSPHNPDDLVFGVANVKKAFSNARVIAGLPDLRFHDLRHTQATRHGGNSKKMLAQIRAAHAKHSQRD